MTRIIAKLFVFTLALGAFLYVGPVFAAPFAFIANGGSGFACTIALPCATIDDALGAVDAGGEIICLDSTAFSSGGSLISFSLTIDCPGVFRANSLPFGGLIFKNNNQVTIRNLTIKDSVAGSFPISATGSGTLIIENCIFENAAGGALDIEPGGPLNLVIKNSRLSNSAGGVLIKPDRSGSVTATFNGVTITGNTGGGVHSDTTNGPVSLDIANSTINNNAGNGLNAVSGAGGANMLNIHNSVIAQNGAAGVQTNGANAAALIDTTLLDSNTGGAISAVGGGRVLTYGNNRIVGSSGTGFTGPTPLQ
jgi:parallel beta helix pectate lyase-like protein